MHLEKRIVGKKRKYYLAHSYREADKVHKMIKYLGTDLTEKLLEERKIIAEKLILDELHRYTIIKDPLDVELSPKEIEEIQRIQAKIQLKIHHLSEKSWKDFSTLFTFNTNAIEGSKLSLVDVKNVLEKNQWLDKSKEDIAEAYGVDEAIRFIRATKDHLSIGLIQNIHKIIFKNSKPFAGKLRKRGEEVVIMDNVGNIVHEGAPQARILHLLNELVSWYKKHQRKYPALLLAAVVHNQFENIHPFADGNGRVGRILLNNILVKHALPPINIYFKSRIEYYESLQAYEKHKDLRQTIDLFMKEYMELKKKLDLNRGKVWGKAR